MNKILSKERASVPHIDLNQVSKIRSGISSDTGFGHCFLCRYAAAAPSERDAKADTLRSDSAVNPDSFQYSYETSNGIKAQEAGQLKQIDKETAIVTHGDFSYQSPEGDTIQLSYTADENGYRPTGDHLPVPPAPEPIPDYIQRSLDYNAQHPYKEV